MFVDDVVIVGGDFIEKWRYLHNIMKIFYDALGLEVSDKKYFFSCFCDDLSLKDFISRLFIYKEESTDNGFKYLGFHLKPNGY